jgi:hypothetical protein
MGKKFLHILAFALLLPVAAMGQRSQELTFGWGGTVLLSDIGAAGASLPQRSNWDIDYRIQAHPHYAFHLSYGEGELYASDAQSAWKERQQRNITVQTPYRTLSARIEVDYFEQRIPSFDFQHSPYLFAGWGLMAFEPQGYYQGDWINLQPLGTEGQGSSASPEGLYGTRARILPFGLGWRAQLNALWVVKTEATWVLTTTDYLDDTHGVYADPARIQESHGDAAVIFADPSGLRLPVGMARGNAQTQDAYFTLNVGLGIHLEAFMEKCSSFLHR